MHYGIEIKRVDNGYVVTTRNHDEFKNSAAIFHRLEDSLDHMREAIKHVQDKLAEVSIKAISEPSDA